MATTADAGDVDGPTAYLERNADVVDVQEAKENDRESWQRALTEGGEADVDDLEETGRFLVELPDGSSAHDVLLVKDREGTLVGACDCDGWIMHGLACAHLCSLAQRDVLEDCISQHHGIAEQLRGARDDDPDDVDVVEEPVDDDRDDQDDDVDEAKPVDPVEPQGSDGGNQPATPISDGETPVTASDPFAQAVANDVPDRFVMDLGGDVYVRREGYARIAHAAGLRVDVEAVTPAESTDFSHARYEARILDEEGEQVARDVGTAHVDQEDLAGAVGELDELAATRAVRRALQWATGAGATIADAS